MSIKNPSHRRKRKERQRKAKEAKKTQHVKATVEAVEAERGITIVASETPVKTVPVVDSKGNTIDTPEKDVSVFWKCVKLFSLPFIFGGIAYALIMPFSN